MIHSRVNLFHNLHRDKSYRKLPYTYNWQNDDETVLFVFTMKHFIMTHLLTVLNDAQVLVLLLFESTDC